MENKISFYQDRLDYLKERLHKATDNLEINNKDGWWSIVDIDMIRTLVEQVENLNFHLIDIDQS